MSQGRGSTFPLLGSKNRRTLKSVTGRLPARALTTYQETSRSVSKIVLSFEKNKGSVWAPSFESSRSRSTSSYVSLPGLVTYLSQYATSSNIGSHCWK